jgi:plastocyanin
MKCWLAASALALATFGCGGASGRATAQPPTPDAEGPAAPAEATSTDAATAGQTTSAGTTTGDDATTAPAAAGGGSGTITGKLTGKKKYRKHAVVYLDGITTDPPSTPVPLDQKGQKFIPHVLPIVRGTTVKFLNNDATGHNVFSPDHEKYDLGTFEQSETREYTFKQLGTYTQLCKLHPSMLAYIVSLPNRYFVSADDKGNFAIEGVPAGSYDLKVWLRRGQADPTKVVVKGGESSTVEIPLKKKKR